MTEVDPLRAMAELIKRLELAAWSARSMDFLSWEHLLREAVSELTKAYESLAAERRAREAAEQALRDLVQAIDDMSNDEQYKAAFLALHVHGFAYSGRQIVTELEAAKAALAATRPPGAPTP